MHGVWCGINPAWLCSIHFWGDNCGRVESSKREVGNTSRQPSKCQHNQTAKKCHSFLIPVPSSSSLSHMDLLWECCSLTIIIKCRKITNNKHFTFSLFATITLCDYQPDQFTNNNVKSNKILERLIPSGPK